MTEPKNTATVMSKDVSTIDASASAQQAPTLNEVFSVPQKSSDQTDDRWRSFQDKLKQEGKGIKWTAAMPDLGVKICELLDIKIHDILITAWKKAEALRQALSDSKLDPERSIYLDLVEHGIDYETQPFIDVKFKGASIKKITLTVALNLKLKGFTLKVQNGAICEIQTGSCEGKGTIKYDRLAIAEKKLSPIKFPLTIKIPNLFATSDAPAKENPSIAVGTADSQKPADPVERIEL